MPSTADPSAPCASPDPRRRYSDLAIAAVPRLLTLVDRNPYSPAYGCFDRAYWHYRTMDFPCGMAQEFVLPLALVYARPYPDNPYHQQERVRELALAGVDFARRSAHRDGSCDDYFPFERALGAAVFSLYACAETCLVLNERRPEHLEFFARRGDWLLANNESGRLANHQALAALALQNVYELTGDARFAEGRDRYLRIVRDWQSDEGWFQEYEGADPGYHSCTISFLAKLMKKTEGTPVAERILAMLRPAVDFAWHFMHPDGSYAGEYGSRNTYHFYPHGFELMAPHEEKAGQIADRFLLRAIPRGTRYFNDDDRMCAHYLYDWLHAHEDYHPERPAPLDARPNFTRHFPKARLLVRKTDRYYAVVGLAKGGVIKVTNKEGPVYSDTGLIGRLADGRVVVSHLMDERDSSVDVATAPIQARVAGCFSERRANLPTPFRQAIFRLLNLTLGRFAPQLMRRMLQEILITGKRRTEIKFERRVLLGESDIEIVDEIVLPHGAARGGRGGFAFLHLGSDATSIYVANSNTYQRSVLLPWQDLGHLIERLNETGRATHRHWAVAPPEASERTDGGS